MHTGIGLEVQVHRQVAVYAEARYVLHADDYGWCDGFFSSHGPVHFGARWFP